MNRALQILLLLYAPAIALAAGDATVKCPSPDGRFALRITAPAAADSSEFKVELIEKASGKAMVDLGVAYRSHLGDTVLVWSADSKRAAYAARREKEGDARVYFWNGSAFDEAPLPDDMPEPKIAFGKAAGESVKNYGGAVKPLRWLKSGELELSNDLMLLSRESGRTYTGLVIFTVTFDAQHHASVHKIGKTKTQVED